MRIYFSTWGAHAPELRGYALCAPDQSPAEQVRRSIERRTGETILAWHEDCHAMDGSYAHWQGAIGYRSGDGYAVSDVWVRISRGKETTNANHT